MSDTIASPPPDSPPPPRTQQLDAATYTVPDLAGLLKCSDRHVWRLVDLDQIPGKIRIGRLVRFSKKLVDEWIEAGCTSKRRAGR